MAQVLSLYCVFWEVDLYMWLTMSGKTQMRKSKKRHSEIGLFRKHSFLRRHSNVLFGLSAKAKIIILDILANMMMSSLAIFGNCGLPKNC